MPVNLLIDTTQKGLMFALTEEANLIHTFQEDLASHRYHSALLIPKIQEALTQCSLKPEDLKAVGINCGPGSFTGIRIGLTFTRLLGQFADVKIYKFNTFELIAGHEKLRNHSVTVLLNAFRNRHYRATLKVNETGNIIWIEPPCVNDNSSYKPINSERCLVENSIKDKVKTIPVLAETIDESLFFTPDVMLFYLQHQLKNRMGSWQNTQPLYLQMPQITTSPP